MREAEAEWRGSWESREDYGRAERRGGGKLRVRTSEIAGL